MNNDSKSYYRYLIFALLSAAYILVYFHRLCTAVVAVDLMRDLQAGGAVMGILGSAYFYPYALMQMPAGLMADSLGPRKSITIFLIIAFAGSVLMGMAPNVTVAIIGRTLTGIGVALLFVPAMKILAEWFRPGEFAFMTGIFIAMGGIGSITATTPLAAMTGLIGWRLSFVLVGLVTLVIAGMNWAVVRDRPSDMGLEDMYVRETRTAGLKELVSGLGTVFSSIRFWPMALWFFFESAVFFSFAGLWGGPYLMHTYGFSSEKAGSILMMFAVGMIIGSPLLSFLSDRIARSRKLVLVASSAVTVFLMALVVARVDAIPAWGLYLLCFATGLSSNAIVVIGFTTVKELFPVSMAGTSVGAVNLFPFAGGAVFQPLLGYIIEGQGQTGEAFNANGYRYAFAVLLACSVIALAMSLLVRETYDRKIMEQGQ